MSPKSNLKKKTRSKEIQAGASRNSEAPVAAPSTISWADAVLPGVIGVLTVLVFLPVLRNGFVGWDDEPNLLDNPNYRGFGWNNLQWMFTTFHHSLYRPLTWMTLAFDHALWGMNPAGYHATSVILHAVNAILFFYLTKLLIEAADAKVRERKLPLAVAAAMAALFFALHPLRVEPVAWVSARNDILSATFFLLTLISYVHYARAATAGRSRRLWFAASVAAYGCSLLAKASGIGLPFVLLVLDWYPLRRFAKQTASAVPARRLIAEKLPFLLLALIFGWVAVVAKYEAGSMAAVDMYGLGARAMQSLYGVSFYLYKTLIPLNLSPLYQVPPDFSGTEDWVLAGAAFALAVGVTAFLLRKRWPAPWAALLCYVIILAPFLGVVQSGPQLVADRCSYLSTLGLNVLIAVLLLVSWPGHRRRSWGRPPAALLAASVVVLGAFSALTWQQIAYWRDTETLWREALAINNESDIAHYNLGRVLARRGDRDAAMKEYREALRIQPQDADNHNGVGLLLAVDGKYGESLEEFQKALQVNPRYAEGYFNLGRVYARQGELEKAAQNYREALKLKPDEAEVHLGLGNVFMASDAPVEAAEHFERAVQLNPRLADAHTALARLFAAQGKQVEAEEHYRKALELLKVRAAGASRN